MLDRLDSGAVRYRKDVADWMELVQSQSDNTTPRRYTHDHLLLARALVAFGRADEALPLLESLEVVAQTRRHMGEEMVILVVHALALRAMNKTNLTLTVLNRALTLTQPQGYIRLFADEGEPMQKLLTESLAYGTHPAFVTRLVAAFNPQVGDVARRPDSNQLLIEPLSERELELLNLVVNGRSNREIADELFLAIGTVKKHLSNIFGKLQVSSRTQAAARARELDLVS